MADFDLILSWVVPTVVSAIIAFVILGLEKFTRTSDDTITHGVKVEDIGNRLNSIDEDLKDHEENFKKINEKIDELKLINFRLDDICKRMGRVEDLNWRFRQRNDSGDKNR